MKGQRWTCAMVSWMYDERSRLVLLKLMVADINVDGLERALAGALAIAHQRMLEDKHYGLVDGYTVTVQPDGQGQLHEAPGEQVLTIEVQRVDGYLEMAGRLKEIQQDGRKAED